MSPDEAMVQLRRILDSATFSKAAVLRRFLQFLVERTLHGRIDEIKEYALGVDVFDRGSDFDPRTDTIVRVQARRLRAKLEQYYEGPGHADRIVIELPKGSYVAAFRSVPRGSSGLDSHRSPARSALERTGCERCRARFLSRPRVLRSSAGTTTSPT